MPRRTLHCLSADERKSLDRLVSERVGNRHPYRVFAFVLVIGGICAAVPFCIDAKVMIPVVDWPLRSILIVVPAGVFPMIMFRLIARIGSREMDDALRARGLCVQCGYDLRASPVRCPECGTERPA